MTSHDALLPPAPRPLRGPIPALVLPFVISLFSVSAAAQMGGHEGHEHLQQSPVETGAEPHPLEAQAPSWTCSMHPQIRRDGPGACPICGMDLIRVRTNTTEAASGPSPSLTLSAAQRARMRIETVPVERHYPTARIRLAGKVTYDETRLADITAWVPGRIDELFVDFTGVRVRAGDHMVKLYSPELLSAQEELVQALRSLNRLSQNSAPSVRQSTQGLVRAARDRLRLWGLNTAQIEEIERRGAASEQVTIYAPTSGIVIRRDVQEGMYVETGTRIFTVADLATVWVQLDAYESDLQWLRYGQSVSFTTEAYPGEAFTGVVSFIDPFLDPATRTVGVRVNVDNPDGRLKPEMFVRAEVSAQLAGQGRVYDRSLAGKWVSPMHPEVVKDSPGQCDICGMDLVPVEELGYMSPASSNGRPPLVIPASAPLVTGTRAVVYVEKPDTERPVYEGREVTLGPRAGDRYIVEHGLAEGERVVVSGAFKIDSALQIQAQPSMMNPEGTNGGHAHHHGGR